MKDYILSHSISILVPVLFIGIGLLFFTQTPTSYWTFILMVTFTLGYIHYFVGGWYQLVSFSRKTKRNRHYVVFFGITLISIVVSLYCIVNNLTIFLTLFVILFFNVHGFLNEKTLLKTQTGVETSDRYFLPWSLVTAGLLCLTFLHPSSMYDFGLQYHPGAFDRLSEDAYAVLHNIYSLGKILFVIGVGTIGTVLFLECRHRTLVLLTGVPLVLALILYKFSPLPYIYVFFFLLSYHFILWSLTYAFLFYRNRRTELPKYTLMHVCIILCCIVCGFASTTDVIAIPLLGKIGAFLFDVRTFITLALVHLSVSLMNEDFFKKIFKLY